MSTVPLPFWPTASDWPIVHLEPVPLRLSVAVPDDSSPKVALFVVVTVPPLVIVSAAAVLCAILRSNSDVKVDVAPSTMRVPDDDPFTLPIKAKSAVADPPLEMLSV